MYSTEYSLINDFHSSERRSVKEEEKTAFWKKATAVFLELCYCEKLHQNKYILVQPVEVEKKAHFENSGKYSTNK